MSNAFNAQGTVLQRGNGATPEVFAAVAEMVEWTGPSPSRGDVEVTHLTSAAVEVLPGLVDNGTLQLSANMINSDATQKAMRNDMSNNLLRNWKLILSDGVPTIAAFAGFVSAYETSGAKGDKVGISFTIRISGAVTWTP